MAGRKRTMKKHLKLAVTLAVEEYPGQSVFQITFSREALRDWCLGLCLLRARLVVALILAEERGTKAAEIQILSGAKRGDKARADLRSEPPRLEIVENQLDYLLSFFLKYYRDGVAEVDHLDLEAVAVGSKSTAAYITITVPDFRPPMSLEELEKLLGSEETP